jgi:hypothetical protein
MKYNKARNVNFYRDFVFLNLVLMGYYRRFGGAKILSVWSGPVSSESVHSSWTAWPLKVGPIGCPVTSVTNYRFIPSNIPEERRPRKVFNVVLQDLICLTTLSASCRMGWENVNSNWRGPVHTFVYLFVSGNALHSQCWPSPNLSPEFSEITKERYAANALMWVRCSVGAYEWTDEQTWQR